MFNTLPYRRPWYEPCITWLLWLFGARRSSSRATTALADRRFPIPAEQAHLYARSADEWFYREFTAADYRHLPPVRMREYRF
mgnify:CR=1 FL=1